MFVRPARSSSFPDPTDMEPADEDEDSHLAAWLDERQQAEESRGDPAPPVSAPPGRAWPKVWTPDQIQDLDDLGPFMDWWYEERDNRWQ